MLRSDIQPTCAPTADDHRPVELSVVIPCLNEADTLGTCIRKARSAIRQHDVQAEIIVADNGSTDGSIEIAKALGARVVPVQERGYGSALMGGIEAARGELIIMGDGDDSYDFREIPKFVDKLREGADLVQGCRLPWGGGTVLPGAMPTLHRWIGNPLFTVMVRRLFGAPINDVYCGLRGFRKQLYKDIDLRCTGMEFATEMVIKSALFKKRIVETPITLHPDGRKSHPPHLRTFRDGWRTLRFFLLYSPRSVFFIPGLILILLGILGYCLALPGINLWGAQPDAHSLLVASLALLLGNQSLQLGLLAKTFAVREGFLPAQRWLDNLQRWGTLETGLIAGVGSVLCGTAMIAAVASQWVSSQFGPLNYGSTMRVVVPGVTLCAFGYQLLVSSFLFSLLSMGKRNPA